MAGPPRSLAARALAPGRHDPALVPALMVVPGTVGDWREWSGLPTLGRYVAPRALAPVDVDHDRDLGVYTEPNARVRHDADRPAGSLG